MKPIICFHQETCIMCGATIPEGRQVCPSCEAKLCRPQPAIKGATTFTHFTLWLKSMRAKGQHAFHR